MNSWDDGREKPPNQLNVSQLFVADFLSWRLELGVPHDIYNKACSLSTCLPLCCVFPPTPPPTFNLTRWHLISWWVEEASAHRAGSVADLFRQGRSSAIRAPPHHCRANGKSHYAPRPPAVGCWGAAPGGQRGGKLWHKPWRDRCRFIIFTHRSDLKTRCSRHSFQTIASLYQEQTHNYEAFISGHNKTPTLQLCTHIPQTHIERYTHMPHTHPETNL